MAASQLEAELTERKLRPLYDAVDNGHNKKAVQMAEKILKKQTDLHCAKALKAIALLRMGRRDESQTLIQEVMNSHPGDQATLQACTMYFRETGDFRKIAELYSDAAKHYHNNQEILTHLFMAYVRISDYQKQQQIAIQLHKAFPLSGPYYCWWVMSVLMQAHEAQGSDMAKNMFLPLAERLIVKYFEENKVDAEAEVRLYLMVLEKLEKREKKLELITGTHGDKLKNDEEREAMKLECLISLERWDEAAKKLLELVNKNPDHWQHIHGYIKAQIHKSVYLRQNKSSATTNTSNTNGETSENAPEEIAKEEETETKTEKKEDDDTGDSTEVGDSSNQGATTEAQVEEESKDESQPREDGDDGEKSTEVEMSVIKSGSEPSGASATEDYLTPIYEVRDLFEQLASEEQTKATGGGYINRGPIMARMEIYKQLKAANLLNEGVQLAPPLDMLMNYFELFGTKNCVFEDLKVFLNDLPIDDVKEFLRRVEEKVQAEPVDFDCPPDKRKENIGYRLAMEGGLGTMLVVMCNGLTEPTAFEYQTYRMHRHMNLLQLQRFMGYHKDLTNQAKQELVDMCRHYYKEGLKLSKDQVETLNRPCDFYVILATHLKLELYRATGEISHFWETIFMLEYAKTYNAQIYMLLMKLYGHISAAESITDIFEALSIKHLQIETLGYYPIRYVQPSGTLGFAQQLYKGSLRFFFGSSKEISEYIIQSYKNGMFHKVVEFVGLRDHLAHSHNFATVMLDMNITELLCSVDSVVSCKEFFDKELLANSFHNIRDYCSRLVDSRDLEIFFDWNPTSIQVNDVETKLSFDFECSWLRVKLALVRCCKEGYQMQLESPQPNGSGATSEDAADQNQDAPWTTFSEKLQEFSKSLEMIDQHVGMFILRQRTMHLLPIQSPPPCLGYSFLQEGHGFVLLKMFTIIEMLAKKEMAVTPLLREILEKLESIKSRISGIPDELREVVGKVFVRSSSSQEGGEVVTFNTDMEHPCRVLTRCKVDLEKYYLFVQTATFVLVACAICCDILTFSDNKKKKKKKKSKGNIATRNELINFMKELKVLLQEVSHLFRPMAIPDMSEEELADGLEKLHLSTEMFASTGGSGAQEQPQATVSKVDDLEGIYFERSVVSRVTGAVLDSYNMSCRDMYKVVVAKTDFIHSLIKQLGGSVD